jgi:hypothetical protein
MRRARPSGLWPSRIFAAVCVAATVIWIRVLYQIVQLTLM